MMQVLFGERLKELRKAKKLTQSALAAKAGITLKSIRNWEQGVSEPTWSDLRRLANALSITICEFEGESPTSSNFS